MTTTVDTAAGAAPEASWESAPGLMEGAMTLALTPEQCDLRYWFEHVAQGTFAGRARTGHTAAEATPDYMREPGPLRDSLILELSWRAVSEELATRVLARYVAEAPDLKGFEFYTTQLVDEARHAMVFRNHLVELGVPEHELAAVIEQQSAEYTREVVDPILNFALQAVADEHDFVGGVAVFTIVIEGVLAPAAELSERKWNVLDPAAGAIARGASIDEIRHLAVGSTIVRDHLIAHPEYRPRLMDILTRGRALWDTIPDREYVLRREELFQKGLEQHAHRIAGYEAWPGRLLSETTPAERYDLAEAWTDDMADARMAYMGVDGTVMRLRNGD